MRRFSVALLFVLVVVGLAGPWLVPFAGPTRIGTT